MITNIVYIRLAENSKGGGGYIQHTHARNCELEAGVLFVAYLNNILSYVVE